MQARLATALLTGVSLLVLFGTVSVRATAETAGAVATATATPGTAELPALAAPGEPTGIAPPSESHPAASLDDETRPGAPTTPMPSPAATLQAAPANTTPTVSLPADAPGAPGAPVPPTKADAAPDVPSVAQPVAPAVADLPVLNGMVKAALDARAPSDAKRPAGAEIRRIHEAVAAFYAARNYQPLWRDDGRVTTAGSAALARLEHGEDDGLTVHGIPAGIGAAERDDDRAILDIALSDAIVSYARQASGSRVDPRSISNLIGSRPELADPKDVLAKVSAAAAEAGNVLEAYNPPQPGYKALRGKLAELRQAHAPVARGPIPAGPDLRVGMRDPRVPLVRARFALDGQPTIAPEDLLYDTRVAAAVADFQKTRGLPASGVLTARTVAALSGGQPSRLENEILANMERWRWMPRDLGESRIEVNVPDFTVSVVIDGTEVHRNKVVVGKEGTPTPIFSNTMKFLIVNPVWNVPDSIVKKEMLPKLAEDPDYLHRLGYEVLQKGGRTIVRQPPGERNALGRIKFMFPNDYAVYLHDTPSRSLFATSRRAYSHGCVRVDQPFDFAQAVLGTPGAETRLKALIGGGKERYVYLPKPLPIHIEYFTAAVDATGRLQLRDDVYGYDHKVKAALGLEG